MPLGGATNTSACFVLLIARGRIPHSVVVNIHYNEGVKLRSHKVRLIEEFKIIEVKKIPSGKLEKM